MPNKRQHPYRSSIEHQDHIPAVISALIFYNKEVAIAWKCVAESCAAA